MDEKFPILPRVFIFEGGDVCGKSTQLNNLYEKCKNDNKHVYKFKFPNRNVKCGEKECHPYDLFDKIHETLYKCDSISKVIENWDTIKEIIKSDIFVNGYDKYNWVIEEYTNILKNDPNSVIFIDRFIDSGNIYNILLPLSYISLLTQFEIPTSDYKEEYTKKEYLKILNDLKGLKNYSDAVTYTILSGIDCVNVNAENEPFEKKLEHVCGDIIKYKNRGLHYENFYYIGNFKRIYFEKSEILYNKFKSEIDKKEVNREVSKYDTNEILKNIVDSIFLSIFGNKRVKNPNSIYFISTDTLLSLFNNKNINKKYKTSEAFLQDYIANKISL